MGFDQPVVIVSEGIDTEAIGIIIPALHSQILSPES